MPPLCTVCRHPEKKILEDGLIRNVPLRRLAQSVIPATSATALHRHRKHLATQLVAAQPAEMTSETTNSLARVESLMQECEKMAAAATAAGEWPVALRALKEAHGCLELLGRLRGRMQQPSYQRNHPMIASQQPRDVFEVELAIAKSVSDATHGFDNAEIERLKALLRGSSTALLRQESLQSLESEG